LAEKLNNISDYNKTVFMASKKMALFVALIILLAFLTGGIFYFSHSSRPREFDVLPSQSVIV
jgi:flagellar biogenesis protein FliO